MTSELLTLGLLDKADLQNEKENLLIKSILCMELLIIWAWTLMIMDYYILPMEANMVFTVEPGIYIPEEGFGVRLKMM